MNFYPSNLLFSSSSIRTLCVEYQNLTPGSFIMKFVLIMMIEHTTFARSDTILSDQSVRILCYNTNEESLVKILLDKDD